MTEFSDASWKDMHPAMWMAREVARQLHVEMTKKDLVITSGRRPKTRGGSSKHETGEAMDIRVWHLGNAQNQWAFADELYRRLGEDFDVIVEGEAARDERYRDRVAHIHVEYDPKGRHADG
jgi:hypothetical protein